MLHWLAGQKNVEAPTDPDATGAIDVPETPAPVFAVRAFKHAIFGTPQTAQPKPRRHSNAEAARPRTQDGRTQRPAMPRPKSASYTHGAVNLSESPPEPMNSPTKGILLTPGTAAAKRKTVSFGDHIKDKKDNVSTTAEAGDDGLENDFQSWNRPVANNNLLGGAVEKSKSSSSLTKALEEVRDESAKRKRAGRNRTLDVQENAAVTGISEPLFESAQYWKAEYDAYRENTQREVRKLVKKQQMAKSYAKVKDDECLTLTDELKQERQKVERLEVQAVKLEAQLKEYQALLRDAQNSQVKPEAKTFDTGLPLSERHEQRPTADHRTVRLGQLGKGNERRGVMAKASLEQPPSREIVEAQPVLNEAKVEQPKSTGESGNVRKAHQDDMCMPSFSATSPEFSSTADKPPGSPTAGRTVTCGTGATPLKSLNINTLPMSRMTRRDSTQPSLPDDARVATSPTREDAKPRAPTVASSVLPSTGTDRVTLTGPRDYKATHHKADHSNRFLDALPSSSPFQSDINASELAAASAKRPTTSRSTQPLITQENQLPQVKRRITSSDSLKPSAAWTAISGPAPAAAEKRISSITDKHGNEVALDRLEAAKARLRAKGRNIS